MSNESKDKVVQVFKDVLYRFCGVEHRVESLGNMGELLVFNDAKSTNWQATMTALMAVRELDLPITLIIGGQLRGQNDLPGADQLRLIKEHTFECLSIGEGSKLLNTHDDYFKEVSTVEGAFEYIRKNERKGIILFSPGFPSFDQFKNYEERGRKFKELFSTEN